MLAARSGLRWLMRRFWPYFNEVALVVGFRKNDDHFHGIRGSWSRFGEVNRAIVVNTVQGGTQGSRYEFHRSTLVAVVPLSTVKMPSPPCTVLAMAEGWAKGLPLALRASRTELRKR